ncbi:uncharacterized protein LOC129910796 [Episyrphus balteatus]|uniref:uncharacterized protein LOC129910796 n=1 Tax=Episyrphus balteatus TaxID=286459 RepID=UPI0024864778|nr:uncharacterized protein LOC129910796 [Episyrphus balteatus]
MLRTRIAPTLAKFANVNIRYASCQSQSVFMQSVARMNTQSTTTFIGRQPNGFLDSTSILKSPNLIAYKAYSTKQSELPSKQELEKYFFKVTVVVWDLIWKITLWAWGMCRKHIINNPAVQSNWKTFNEKLEEARKN